MKTPSDKMDQATRRALEFMLRVTETNLKVLQDDPHAFDDELEPFNRDEKEEEE